MKYQELVESSREILKSVEETILKKNEYYSILGDDVLVNFRIASSMLGKTISEILLGFLAKHIARYIQQVQTGVIPTQEVADELIRDMISYLVIQYGVWSNERKQGD